MDRTGTGSGVFDVATIVAELPSGDDRPGVSAVVTATADGSVRVLRVSQATPAHYHATADEHAYLLSGSATFFVADAPPRTLTPGQMVFVTRGTVHGILAIHEEPLVLLIIDTPRRAPDDMIFIDAKPT